ncbi:hypothetical protein [Methylomonas denitrificans]|uniref:Uncharacterized protein n=1 Tax=Methylomonas denitrificans TaxID=1538553 RepID=A0A126T967_9GAMM|nr:hypothetical protein [Methylomonas denitrificans]AMK78602.1 hypothetical protein JT25_019265 [Methylomonas denitrificans]
MSDGSLRKLFKIMAVVTAESISIAVGSQYAGREYRQHLAVMRMEQSMSRKGNCLSNDSGSRQQRLTIAAFFEFLLLVGVGAATVSSGFAVSCASFIAEIRSNAENLHFAHAPFPRFSAYVFSPY